MDQQPTLKELNLHARKAEWLQLGVNLELDNVGLDECRDCTSVYKLWIEEKAERATRRNLLDALRDIRLNNVVKN